MKTIAKATQWDCKSIFSNFMSNRIYWIQAAVTILHCTVQELSTPEQLIINNESIINSSFQRFTLCYLVTCSHYTINLHIQGCVFNSNHKEWTDNSHYKYSILEIAWSLDFMTVGQLKNSMQHNYMIQFNMNHSLKFLL